MEQHAPAATEQDQKEPSTAPKAREYYAERDGDGPNRRDWDTYVVKSGGEGRTCTMHPLNSEGRHNTMWERANEIADALNNHARAQRIEAALVELLERLEDLGQTNGANYSMNRDTVGGYTARDWALGYVNKETLEARAALES